ncbi:MAG TPA: DUF3180 family protein [Microbacteriaceae bacterium]|nr:DUF3180 family protein [Microbacteriaceae bacterium]
MNRTAPWTLVSIGVGGLVVGWLIELLLVAVGRPVIVPPYPLAGALVVLAVAVVAVAVPVRRVAKGEPGARVDPFYATRVLVLAKSASIAAAGLAGLFGGALVFIATRPVIVDDLMWKSIAGLAASAALLVAGIVAEGMCRIPPRDDDERGGSELPGGTA